MTVAPGGLARRGHRIRRARGDVREASGGEAGGGLEGGASDLAEGALARREPQTTHHVVMPRSLLARLKAAVAEGRAAGGKGNVSRLIVEVLLGRYPKEGDGPE